MTTQIKHLVTHATFNGGQSLIVGDDVIGPDGRHYETHEHAKRVLAGETISDDDFRRYCEESYQRKRHLNCQQCLTWNKRKQ